MATPRTSILQNDPLVYLQYITEDDDRLDCAWSNPLLQARIDTLLSQRRPDVRVASVGKIAKVRGGKRLPAGTLFVNELADGIPYVRISDVKHLEVQVDTAARIPKSVHRLIQRYQLHKDDLVFTIVGATIGKAGKVNQPVETVNFTENLAKITLDDEQVLPEFVLHILDSELVQAQTERLQVGALQFKVSLDSCRSLQILLPWQQNRYSLRRQRDILAQFNTHLAKAKALRVQASELVKESQIFAEKKLALPAELTHYTDEAYLAAMTDNSDRLDFLYLHPYRQKLVTGLAQAPHAKLKDLLIPEPQSKIPFSDYYKVVDQEQVSDKLGKITGYKELPFLGSSKRLLKSNCLIISKMQSKYGKLALVGDDYAGCVASSEFLQYSPKRSDVDLRYIWAILRSIYSLSQWKFSVTGSSRMRIGPDEIGETIVPLPAAPIRQQIVEEIEQRLQKSERLVEEADALQHQAQSYFIQALNKQ